MDKEVDEFTSCPVCFEDYEESGDHVPRLLPCSHTLCDKCLRELKQGNRIRCPQDRQTYKASRKFPQNNYILNQIRAEKERRYKKCDNHGRDINLFCRNEACQQELCSLCLTENHKKHDVVDLFSFKKAKAAEIAKEIEKAIAKLKTYGLQMKRAGEEAKEEFSKTLTEVNTQKEELSVQLDERLSDIDNVISTMTKIKENLSMESTYTEMSSSQTIIRKETANLTKIFERTVPFIRFKPRREDKCVGHSFETHHPQQCERPKVDQPTLVNDSNQSVKKERAQPEPETLGEYLFYSRFFWGFALCFICGALMTFLKDDETLPIPIPLNHVSSQAHIIQTDMQTCRNHIEESLSTLMSECFSTMFPDRKITYKSGEDPRKEILYKTRRPGNSSKVEWFVAECITWPGICNLIKKPGGEFIGINWDVDEYSEDPQQTKFTTTVKCDAVESSFCMMRGNSLHTIHNIFFNLVQRKFR